MKFKNIGEVIYCGILLCKESQEKLKALVSKLIPEPIPGILGSWKIACEHLTLGFGTDVTPEMLKCVGMPVESLNPHKILVSEICAGMFFEDKVLMLRNIPWKSSIPGTKVHVTLAHRLEVQPCVVGRMYEYVHTSFPADPTYSLSGKVGVFIDGKWYCE